jgi:hypothetical protein
MTEERQAVQDHIDGGDFGIEWTQGRPEVHFWAGEPFGDIVKAVSLRDLLFRELQVAVPREYFGNPMAFASPKDWVHAEQVRLLQALLQAYDRWERRAR